MRHLFLHPLPDCLAAAFFNEMSIPFTIVTVRSTRGTRRLRWDDRKTIQYICHWSQSRCGGWLALLKYKYFCTECWRRNWMNAEPRRLLKCLPLCKKTRLTSTSDKRRSDDCRLSCWTPGELMDMTLHRRVFSLLERVECYICLHSFALWDSSIFMCKALRSHGADCRW